MAHRLEKTDSVVLVEEMEPVPENRLPTLSHHRAGRMVDQWLPCRRSSGLYLLQRSARNDYRPITRPNSYAASVHGGAPMRSSTPRRSDLTGSITGDYLSRSVTHHWRSSDRSIIANWRRLLWRPNSNKRVFTIPGTVHCCQ